MRGFFTLQIIFAGKYFCSLKNIFGSDLMGEIGIEDYIVEWDDNKAEINLKKHGIRFKSAARVFLDENRIEEFDELHSDFEDRIKVIGRVGKILVVIYTERGERYRIISARYANREEIDEYYGQYQNL